MATKMMKFFSGTIGQEWLRAVIGSCVQSVVDLNKSLEIDAHKMKDADDVDANREALLSFCSSFLQSICSSAGSAPFEFHSICTCLSLEVSRKFPGAHHSAVGGFLCLRFFCPGLSVSLSFPFRSLFSPLVYFLLVCLTTNCCQRCYCMCMYDERGD